MKKPTFKDLSELTWKLTTYGGSVKLPEDEFTKQTLLRLKVFCETHLHKTFKLISIFA